jgi:hypothetical protein
MAKIKQVKKPRRSPHRTQWTAQFAVASELCKRGYEVAFTMGNHPMVDLIVISPKKTHLVVDVKGLYRRNPWPVRRQALRDNLFYVFAFVPDNGPNQFFILTYDQANEGIKTEFEKTKERKETKGLTIKEAGYFFCVEWDFAVQFKDKWDALPK